MKTPAIIASLTVVGSIAYAAGSQGTAGKQPPVMPSGTQAHSMQEEMPQTRMQQSPGCPSHTVEYWFSPIPHLIGCTTGISPVVLTNGTTAADVNGDGQAEYFTFRPIVVASVLNGSPLDGGNPNSAQNSYVSVSRLERIGNEFQARETRVPIFDASIGAWCLENLPQPAPPTRMVAIYFVESGNLPGVSGWRDMDGDGDLDFVCRVTDEATWNAQIWLENIGYEKPAPAVAADLNRDGKVDGADMGLLLYAWGPNQ
jgi:hypothetical protein